MMIMIAGPPDRRSREWPLEAAKSTSTPLRKVFKVSPWTPSLSRLVPTNIKRPEGGKLTKRIQQEKRFKSKANTSSLSSLSNQGTNFVMILLLLQTIPKV